MLKNTLGLQLAFEWPELSKTKYLKDPRRHHDKYAKSDQSTIRWMLLNETYCRLDSFF